MAWSVASAINAYLASIPTILTSARAAPSWTAARSTAAQDLPQYPQNRLLGTPSLMGPLGSRTGVFDTRNYLRDIIPIWPNDVLDPIVPNIS